MKYPNRLNDEFSRWINSVSGINQSWCVFTSLVILSALSCILGTFYDDEIFSIKWAIVPWANVFEFIKHINSNDIHPPLSYVLDKFIFDALGNWKAVQFINGIANAGAIAWFHSKVEASIVKREHLILTFALGTAVTTEMWGTGLRWSAYFNPVFLILYTIALSKMLSVTARLITLTAGTIFLFHTAYVTVIAAPLLWGTFFFTSMHEVRPILFSRVVPIIIVGAAACAPQLYFLIAVHWPLALETGGFQGRAPYLFGLLYSVLQTVSTLTVGNAVFPIDYLPCFFLILLAAASISSEARIVRDPKVTVIFYGLVFSVLLLVVTNLGYEGRTAAFLYPVSVVLIVLSICRSAIWIRWPAMVILIFLQIMSVYNYVFHRDTAKGSYNTPFLQAMDEIRKLTRTCPGDTVVFTHDPVLTYLIDRAGGKISSPYETKTTERLSVHKNDCVVIADTYRGSFEPSQYAEYTRPLDPKDFRMVKTIDLGYDRFHAVKSWISKEPFPRYYITIDLYDVLNDDFINDWSE
jgi:hypothetical protein